MKHLTGYIGLFLFVIGGGLVATLWPRIVSLAGVLVEALGVLALIGGYALAGAVVLGAGAALVYFIRGLHRDHAHQAELQRIEADRLRAEAAKSATLVTVAKRTDEIVITDLLGRREALHTLPLLAMTSHVNGMAGDPTPGELERWTMRQALLGGRQSAPAIIEPGVIEAPRPGLIETMARLDRILLVGGTGTGKTNVLKHYVSALVQAGATIRVIDPHSPSKLLGLDVIGAGLNWREIGDYFCHVMATVDARYKAGQIAQDGDMGGLNEYLIIEEFLDIQRNLGDLATEFLECLLIQARKAGFRYTVVAQNDTVEALGIRGNSGLLKTGTDRVMLRKFPDGQRVAMVGRDKDEVIECDPPPLFTGAPDVPASQLVLDVPRTFTDKERAILRAMRDPANVTKADVYRAAGLSKSGPNSQIIDELSRCYAGVGTV